MAKAALYVVNTTTGTDIAIGGSVPFTTIARRFGCGANLRGTQVALSCDGYYAVEATVTLLATAAAAPYTVTLLQNGVAVPGATASGVAAATGDAITLPISAIVRVCGGSDSLDIVVTETAAELSSAAMSVVKL